MTYVIKHPTFGIYTGHELVPRFTWKYADKKGKRMTKAEAEGIIELFKLKGCTVEPVKDGSR